MTSPFFGFVINEQDTDAPTPVISDFSIIGLVLPSQDANAAVFPLNTAVSVNSGDPTVLAAMGTGPLYRAVGRINAQLADLEVSAQIVIVRVAMAFEPDGVTENVAGTIANIVGDPNAGTGLYALPKAPQTCNVTPRLLGAPGYTGWTASAAQALAIGAQGSGYKSPVVTFSPAGFGAVATATASNVGVQAVAHAVEADGEITGVAIDNGGQDYPTAPSVTFAGGGGTGAAAHAVVANGIVTAIVMDNEGTGYTSAPTVTLSAPPGGEITGLNLTSPGAFPPGTTVTVAIADSNGGAGAGATATLTLQQLANPVCAALPAVAASLLAHYIVGGPGGSKQDALNWRTLLNDKRCIAQDDWEIVASGQGTAYIDGAARSLGLAVRTDFQHSGYPFYAWANTPVQGALGLKRFDSFSLTDGATDGQELLAAGVGVTVRGDASDTSLDSSGFVAVSVNNCNPDTNLNFYNKTRGRDFIDLTLIKTIRTLLGKNNISVQSVQAVLTTMTQVMVDMPNDGEVGYQIGFKASDNSVAALRAGKFTVYDNSEEAAPICQITINRALDAGALTAELVSLASATSTVNA